jgi:uroporphyrin-III C-methyltransferase/precorrin-2 dehydrogenase/sirohydrochlorin ferrochelatase
VSFHPIFLRLAGREVVVVGGGAFAVAKATELLAAEARVTVVAESPAPELVALARAGRIGLVERSYRTGDLDGAWLAVAAGTDPAVSARIKVDADRARIWLNAVDDLPNCSFIAGSVHRQGDVVVAVTTGGACPALAVRIRQLIGRLIGPEYGRLAALAGGLRAAVTRRIAEFERRKRFWYSLVDSPALGLLRQGRRGAALRIAARLLREESAAPTETGRVVLVGAGPGDPGLITALGAAWLRAADVVVYDRLVNDALLREARSDARLIDVGKIPFRPSIAQAEINRILISEARAGQLVVRLKGGDSFVFGRGAEEADALGLAGIPCQVVPGVTSAIAAPASAGIPVTERGVSAGFAVVTGRDAGAADPIEWDAVARIPTVVVLMAVSNLGEIAERLMAGGRSGDTPAAVVMNGTLPDERTVRAPLREIAAAARAVGIGAPAILVVGQVTAVDRRIAAGSLPVAIAS